MLAKDLKTWLSIILFSVLVNVGFAQEGALCIEPKFQQEVKSYLAFSVPTISVSEAYAHQSEFVFLDAREKDEYDVSHIDEAVYIGYKDFRIDRLENVDRSRPVIVYCSIGYRSEKIGEKLKSAGFEKVYNLYGSIFEWVNQHHTVVDNYGDNTTAIHTFNKKWSRWVTNEEMEKVF